MIGLGVTYMLVGMATVFVFLTLLVGATALMSRCVNRVQTVASPAGTSQEEIAAITAAIAQHRRKAGQ